jgi:L-amino acid N-acyltransferase YncA
MDATVAMPEPNLAEIRRATEADLDAIAHVLVDTWRTTFRGLLSDAFLDDMSYEHQRMRHLRTMARDKTAYFVATDSRTSDIVGFVNGGPNRHGEYRYAGELYAIYISRAHQGRGIGKKLFCALADRLLQLGLPSIIVWMLAQNPYRGFYEAVGGREVATRPITLGPETVEEIAYAWDDLASTLSALSVGAIPGR